MLELLLNFLVGLFTSDQGAGGSGGALEAEDYERLTR
ncbi:hypothetical protein IW245_002345 [Longispora fulva]|uniref:Uncharacterized protein n=1 Tax=Longispora fulva TaxID=619741 RepID=A0A8J7GEC5_9ACTN|nr:hypothetical protein [Longispora fulva]